MARPSRILHDLRVPLTPLPGKGLWCLGCAFVTSFWSGGLLSEAVHLGSSGDDSAWGKSLGLYAYSAVLLAFAIRLVAVSLHYLLRLPTRRRPGGTISVILRILAAIPLLFYLQMWTGASAPTRLGVLILGFGVAALIAYDAPKLVANAMSCLRLRRPLV